MAIEPDVPKNPNIFKIDWKQFPSIDEACNSIESRTDGIYIIYKSREPYYIGKSQDLNKRLSKHRQDMAHFSKSTKWTICLGMIYVFHKSRLSPHNSPEQLKYIESFFINNVPNQNSEQTKKSYKGYDLIIFNTGNYIALKSIMAYNKELLDLLLQTSKKYATSGIVKKERKKEESYFSW